ncbi:phage late control D family protein, partial [Acinetobacter boissieri]|uniref:phage late control D family protein n=1 Tax=Acinetobacter boissieri TaxID=1219383 RepID=UPI001BB4635A
MYHTIDTLLEKLGIGAKNRAIHIQFSHKILNSQVFLQRVDGTHHLNQGIKLQLICLSNVPNIALKQFIGSQVAVDVVTDQSKLSRITGIVTQADVGSSDGSLTLYRLQVEDATALWHHRRNSRVFMNKSVIDIVQTLFQEWQNKSSLFASSLTLDRTGLSKTYDIRPFTMQSNESDHHFITRLLRSEGINWLIDEPEPMVTSVHSPIQAQTFKLIDDNAQYSRLTRQSIAHHRSSAVQPYDTISSLIAQRQLQPTAVHVQRWHADRLEVEEGAGSIISTHQQSEQHNHSSLGLEQAWHFSPAWVTDFENTDDATAASHHQVERFNQQLSQSYALHAKQFTATSTVRDAQVGYWFKLQSQGVIDKVLHAFDRSKDTTQDTEKDHEFIITGKIFYNQNNLPKDLNQQIQALVHQSDWQPSTLAHLKQDERQANHLILQRRHVAIIPEYHPKQHKPVV